MAVLKPIRGVRLNKGHPFARDLAGCWLMNEGMGGIISDLSTSRNHGSVIGTDYVWSGESGMGSVVDFGSSSLTYFQIADITSLTSGQPLTIIWRCIIGGFAAVMGSNIGGLYQDYVQLSEGNYLRWRAGTAINNFTNLTSFSGWYDYAITSDGKGGGNCTLKAYQDGIFKDQLTNATGGFGHFDRIGSGYSNNVFSGAISYLFIFHRVLSPAEIALLHREPFCMFAQAAGAALMYVPKGDVTMAGYVNVQSVTSGLLSVTSSFNVSIESGTGLTAFVKITGRVGGSAAGTSGVAAILKSICSVSGSATGVAVVSGSLSITGDVSLAGVINAESALAGVLTLGEYAPWAGGFLEIERGWLREALFNGMTVNAFKLGTILNLGWFWVRINGCSVLYRGIGMEQIDFINILAVAEKEAHELSPAGYVPNDSNSTQYYVIRRFNNCGYQEQTLAAAVKVSVNSNGDLAMPQPNNIFISKLERVDGSKVKLVWFYCPLDQKSRPVIFNVYFDNRSGQIDYQNPLAMIGYTGRKFYSFQSDTLGAGEYLFAVKAADASGVESGSLSRLSINPDIIKPEAINILDCNAV